MTPFARCPSSPEVEIPLGDVGLRGNLTATPGDRGIVVFAHGSGSSRLSRRNRYVARVLENAGLSTLLFDLLTADEERLDRVTGRLRFDVERLGRRLVGVTDWLASCDGICGLATGTDRAPGRQGAIWR